MDTVTTLCFEMRQR